MCTVFFPFFFFEKFPNVFYYINRHPICTSGSSGAKSQQRPTCIPQKPAALDNPRNGNPTLPTSTVAISHSDNVLSAHVLWGRWSNVWMRLELLVGVNTNPWGPTLSKTSSLLHLMIISCTPRVQRWQGVHTTKCFLIKSSCIIQTSSHLNRV